MKIDIEYIHSLYCLLEKAESRSQIDRINFLIDKEINPHEPLVDERTTDKESLLLERNGDEWTSSTPVLPDLTELHAKGAKAWGDIPNATQWVEEQRGNVPEPSPFPPVGARLRFTEGGTGTGPWAIRAGSRIAKANGLEPEPDQLWDGPPYVDPATGKTWRNLGPKAVIQEGDERSMRGAAWIPCVDSIGKTIIERAHEVGGNLRARRLVTEPGEVIAQFKRIVVQWVKEEEFGYGKAMRVVESNHPRFVVGSRFDYGFFNIASEEGYIIISNPPAIEALTGRAKG